jgi:hypothetical protein
MTSLPPLTLDTLKSEASAYARLLSATPIPSLFGVTDGKAVGTYVEASFNTHILESYGNTQGNAARGIDFPALDVDLKVTSTKQPQSSCPFRDATQKVYGLGYHLLVFVYAKGDDPSLSAARLDIEQVLFIDKRLTADFQTTTGLRQLLDRGGNVDDLDAFMQERNLPLDEIGRRSLAEKILEDPPPLGCLTISNALQWRLQYGRALQMATPVGGDVPEALL